MNNDISLKRLGLNLQVLSEAFNRIAKERDELTTQLIQARNTARQAQAHAQTTTEATRAATGLPATTAAGSPAQSGDFDVVFFWKQSDSGLYGRRSDMVMKYLLASGKVGRILHFDAPASVLEIGKKLKDTPAGNPIPTEQRQTLARWMKQLDTDRYLSRQFIYRDGATDNLLGQALPERDSYIQWAIAQIRGAGLDPARTIAWVCPVVWDFPAIADRFPFAAIVADLIDDQRTWKASPEKVGQLDECYRATLKLADLVFTNCQPVADAFQEFAESKPIHIVPNGAERFDISPQATPPARLAGISGPIIGYAGNLCDRIDWVLLAEAVKSRPNWSFVFIGTGQQLPQALDLASFKNVHFLGVVEYAELPLYLRSFDVAIVPHADNNMTKRMNPLKIYNYLSAGLPVVATDIANIDDVRPLLRIADNAKNFVAKIELALKQRPSGDTTQLMEKIGWDKRISAMLGAVEPMFQSRRARVAEPNDVSHKTSIAAPNDISRADDIRQILQLELILKDTGLENELLLLQLHQVQEELEHYFLQSQEDKRQLDQSNQERDAQAKLAAERQTQVEQLSQAYTELAKARDDQAKFILKRQVQINQLTQAKAEAEKLANERAQQLEQAGKARDEQAHLATERQKLIAQLTQARDEQTKLAAERQAQVEQLSQAKAAAVKLANERAQQFEQAGKARDEQARITAECQAQLAQLTEARNEQLQQLAARQTQIQDLTQRLDQLGKQAHEMQTALEEQQQTATAHRDEAQKLKELLDEQTSLAQERQALLDQFTLALADESMPAQEEPPKPARKSRKKSA